MPPAPEKTATVTPPAPGAPAAAPAAPPPMFSPVGLVVVFLLLVVEGVVVFLVARSMGQTKEPEIKPNKNRTEIEIGTCMREFPIGDDATRLTDTFTVKVAVVLNPKFDDAEALKAEVERFKLSLKSRVHEILWTKPRSYFYDSENMADLKKTLLQELNQVLKAPDGQPRLVEVFFIEFKTLNQR